MKVAAASFAMGATCLSVAHLSVLQDGGGALQEGGAGFAIKRKRGDQGVGGIADLAERDQWVFPP